MSTDVIQYSTEIRDEQIVEAAEVVAEEMGNLVRELCVLLLWALCDFNFQMDCRRYSVS